MFLDPASNRRDKEFDFPTFELKLAENRFEEILATLDSNNNVGIGFANRKNSGISLLIFNIAFPFQIFSAIISISS
jgi:hypothetical protein